MGQLTESEELLENVTLRRKETRGVSENWD